jgi:hypothetical protein
MRSNSQTTLLPASDSSESPIVSLDQALERIGGFGKFQIGLSILTALLYGSGTQVLYSIPFYQLYPELTCYETTDLGTTLTHPSCSRELACSSPSIKYQIDWTADKSIHNWMTDLDLICSSQFEIGMIGSI